jgi:hypothetical protein
MLGYNLSIGLNIFNFFRFDFNFGWNKEFRLTPLISKKKKKNTPIINKSHFINFNLTKGLFYSLNFNHFNPQPRES